MHSYAPAGENGGGLSERGISDESATMQDIHALVERWKRIAVHCGATEELVRGGGGNHGRKLTPVGQLHALLSQGPTTVAQVKGMHALAKLIEKDMEMQ
jgi:hypothetical protein